MVQWGHRLRFLDSLTTAWFNIFLIRGFFRLDAALKLVEPVITMIGGCAGAGAAAGAAYLAPPPKRPPEARSSGRMPQGTREPIATDQILLLTIKQTSKKTEAPTGPAIATAALALVSLSVVGRGGGLDQFVLIKVVFFLG